ncbi:MAG: BREX system ATP-binding domain-containing protein [Thermodesulfobacteriota bacterium]
MNTAQYLQVLDKEDHFNLRRAIERLRVGLFDPLAVRLLTAREQRLNQTIDQGLKQIESGIAPHLCICGSYGQGKSHSLVYIKDRARSTHFVTSMINLDLRELPLHNFRQVYRALMRSLRFPDTEATLASHWRKWAKERLSSQTNLQDETAHLLPPEIPHLFRSILVAIAQKNISLSDRQKQLKKHAGFRPGEIPSLLERALTGEVVPVNRLRNALKYRQVPFYKNGSLSYKGTDIFIQMIQGVAKLFRQMGYCGWVILFDEGESITQLRISARARSYRILDRLFALQGSASGLYPVFAFTDDFFKCVQEEDYERTRIRRDQETPYFSQNYFNLWNGLTVHRLQDLSRQEWDELAERLLHLYVKAFKWQPAEDHILQKMRGRITELLGEETRYILKALVEQLDVLAF